MAQCLNAILLPTFWRDIRPLLARSLEEWPCVPNQVLEKSTSSLQRWRLDLKDSISTGALRKPGRWWSPPSTCRTVVWTLDERLRRRRRHSSACCSAEVQFGGLPDLRRCARGAVAMASRLEWEMDAFLVASILQLTRRF